MHYHQGKGRRVALLLAGVAAFPAAAIANTSINSGATVLVSGLSATDAPEFKGGILEVDRSGAYGNNFTLDEFANTFNTIDSHGNAGTFSGIFSDTTVGGPLVINDSVGGGSVTLAGINTYTGDTTINAGASLLLTGGGSIAKSAAVDDEGTLDISGASGTVFLTTISGGGNVALGNNSLSVTIAGGTLVGVISGSGGLIITNGTETLTGDSTYTGGTAINGGALQIGAGTDTGSIVGNVADNGILDFDRTDDVAFGGIVSGSGSLTQMGSGSLTLTAADTYTGTTLVSAGSLILGAGGSIAASSNLIINGTFDISGTAGSSIKSLSGSGTVQLGAETLTITAATGSFTGVIAGTGGLTVTGGTETLLGANTYSGPTAILGGTLATNQATIGNITDNGTLALSSGNPVAISGLISGTGGLSQLGTGTASISTAQTYTGATLISVGTLALTAAGSIADSSGVTANGTLDISATTGASIASLAGTGGVVIGAQSLTLTDAADKFSGVVSGTGGVTLDSGAETFSGANTYTGVTTIAGGTLALSVPGAIAASSAVVDDATLDISGISGAGTPVPVTIVSLRGSGDVVLGTQTLALTAAADTFSGDISGTGGLTITGGSETLTGASSLTGTVTTVSGATLALSGAGSLASAIVADNGTFDVSAVAGTVTLGSLAGSGAVALGANTLDLANASTDFTGVIAGAGGVTVSGGIQTLSGANSYTGPTTITGGTLQLGDGGTAGTVIGNIVDNGTLAFDRSDSPVFAAVISGTGGLNQNGTGTTILTAANTYAGGTTITLGTLQLGNGGATGSIAGNVTDNGTLAFDRSDAVSYAATVSGTGGISQIGTGTLTLTAANTYTGSTAVAAGSTLAVGTGGSIAASSNVVGNGVLDISAAGATHQVQSLGGSGTILLGAQTLALTNGADTFAGVISGTGGLTLGGGAQTLSGTSTYTGATAINGGTLAINGAIASSSGVTVNAGGTLAGTGTVSALSVNGGAVAPGVGGVGTLHVQGPVSFTGASNLVVNLSSASVPALAVSGAAAVGGTVTVASTDGTYPLGQKLAILTASGGVNGTFALAPIPGTGATFSGALSYDTDDVFLQIKLAKLSPLLPSGSDTNQLDAIGGIDRAIAAGNTLPQAFENLGNVSSAALGADAVQLAGETGADIAHAGRAVADPFLESIFAHINDDDLGNGAQRGRQVWATGLVGTDTVRADDLLGAHRLRSSVTGFAGGVDYSVSPSTTLGGALSVGADHFRIADGQGTGRVDAVQLGVYGDTQYTRRIYGAFAGTLALDDVKTDRVITVSGTDDLSGKVRGFLVGGRYETGIRLGFASPYVAIADQLFDTPSYAETAASGSGNFALSYAAQTRNTASLELGLRQSALVGMNRFWTLKLTDRLGWEHDITGASGVQTAFAALPASGFTVYGAQPAKDAARVSFGAEARNTNGLSLNLHFDSQVASRSQTYTGMAGATVRW